MRCARRRGSPGPSTRPPGCSTAEPRRGPTPASRQQPQKLLGGFAAKRRPRAAGPCGQPRRAHGTPCFGKHPARRTLLSASDHDATRFLGQEDVGHRVRGQLVLRRRGSRGRAGKPICPARPRQPRRRSGVASAGRPCEQISETASFDFALPAGHEVPLCLVGVSGRSKRSSSCGHFARSSVYVSARVAAPFPTMRSAARRGSSTPNAFPHPDAMHGLPVARQPRGDLVASQPLADEAAGSGMVRRHKLVDSSRDVTERRAGGVDPDSPSCRATARKKSGLTRSPKITCTGTHHHHRRGAGEEAAAFLPVE